MLTEMREKVYVVIRDSSRSFVTETDVDQLLMEAMDDLSSRLRIRHGSVTAVTSDDSIALPDDYMDFISLDISDDSLTWVDNNEWAGAVRDADGSYLMARIFGGSIELYPTPDVGTAYTLRYWASGPDSLDGFTGTLKTKCVQYARAHALYKVGEETRGDRYLSFYEQGLPSPNLSSRNQPQLPSSMSIAGGPFDTYDASHI